MENGFSISTAIHFIRKLPLRNRKKGIQSNVNGSEFVNGAKSEQINDGEEKNGVITYTELHLTTFVRCNK
jgi:hypothetical protein